MASSWLICTWLYIVTLGMVHALTTQVDDSEIYESTRPNGIQYPSTQPGGDWARLFPPDSDGRYQSTILFTGTVGALAVYFFKGTSIGYYSDMSPQLENMLVTLDGRNSSSINTEGASAYQKLLWSESNLDDGDHQLIVSLGLGSDSEFTASLDYLEVTHTGDITPSKLGPGARDSHSGVIIDNKDPQINYKGEWSSRRSNPPRSHYYSGSQHSTKQLGDSLTFNFTGTAIYYFAEKKPSNGRVSISIDGGAGDTVDTSLPASDDNPPQFSQVLCWSQTGLSDRPHTVKITHMGDSGMDVSLDFFKYTPSQKGGSQSTPLAAIIGGSGPPERVDNDTKDSEKLASQSIVETTVPYKGHQQEPTNKPMSEVSVSSAGPASSRARMTPQLYHGLPEPHTA